MSDEIAQALMIFLTCEMVSAVSKKEGSASVTQLLNQRYRSSCMAFYALREYFSNQLTAMAGT